NNSDLFSSLVGNKIIPMTDDSKHNVATDYVGWIANTLTSNSRIYVSDNWCNRTITNPGTQWSYILDNNRATQTMTSPIDLSEYTIRSSSEIENYLLGRAGAFFWDRDYVDERVVQHIADRTGTLINSPYSTPARVSKLNSRDTSGEMSNGYDWSSNPEQIVVNGTTVYLTQNCTNITQVISHIDSQLPAAVECIQSNGVVDLNYVELRTVAVGSNQTLVVSGDGLATLGLPAGTYVGADGSGYDFLSTSRALNIPSDPHEDYNFNGHTNLEEWILTFTGDEVGVLKSSKLTNTSSYKDEPKLSEDRQSVSFKVFPNPSNGQIFITDPSNSIPLERIQVRNISGKLVYDKTIGNEESINQYRVDLSYVNPGIYFLIINPGENFTSMKIIVR
ncbi:MAG: T9SS type A sorting domain-containing protein, partial [Halanaerobiales bacterium]|nr:T9SS type A sorting domain-containing protein [Halanaerobiales bacterium]